MFPISLYVSLDQQDRPLTESKFLGDIFALESDGPKCRYDGSYSNKVCKPCKSALEILRNYEL